MLDWRSATLRLVLGLALAAGAGLGSLAWLLAAEPALPAPAAEPAFPEADLEFFEKKVRPILVQRCGECHGAEIKEAKGGLRLHTRAAVLQGGDTKAGAVPGKPAESLIIDAVNYGDLYQMPPKSKLPAEEIAILTRWVELGLPWPKEAAAGGPRDVAFDLAARKAEHWAWHYQPYQVPNVKDAAWARTPVDRFLLARLEAANLRPAERAARETLLRRLSFDLTGLPPTPAEVDQFLADTASDFDRGYEQAVDRLLRSPHFGERWARHWMDLVRYAESRGHEFDYNMSNIWHYRDYLIRAFNADLPYNDFVVEQVAGDLLPQPRRNPEDGSNESLVGTGFWFLGEWVHSPVDIRQDEMDRFDNMIDVFGKTFLGLTIGCARCHDHKFDAISQKDYYALAGYLESSAFRMARFDTDLPHRELADRLARLRSETTRRAAADLATAYREGVVKTPDYLLAAAEVHRGAKPDQPLDALRPAIEERARAKQLEAGRLAAWVAELRTARGDLRHPLHLFAAAALEPQPADDPQFARQLAAACQSVAQLPAFVLPEGASVVIDYGREGQPWLADGVAFGPGPRRAGDWRIELAREGQPLAVETESAAVRDLFWAGLTFTPGTQHDWGRNSGIHRAGQAVRTPTFTVGAGPVWSLVAGEGHSVAVVCSHQLVEGPLHGGLSAAFKHEGGKFRWLRQDLSRYRGQRVHLEFAPQGASPLAIRLVVQSNSQPPEPDPSTQLAIARAAALARWAEGEAATLAKLAAKTSDDLAQAVSRWSGEPATTPAVNDPPLAAWLLAHPDLFAAPDHPGRRAAQDEVARYAAAEKELAAAVKRDSRLTFAMWDGDPQDEFLLIRGNSRTPGALVPRGLPAALYGAQQAHPATGSGRLEMARRLVDAKTNPLIAKVYVNRVWHHLFGRGLVASTDNFGVLGEKPTHPELLQYLADQFVAEGWSTKKLIKSLVLSSAYQMASAPVAAAEEIDPTNKLWHRANIRRLEGEAIRDALLAISGRLDPKMFGQSVPVHLTEFMQGRGRPGSGPLDGNGRRSIYISVRRNFLAPMMLAFDTPIPFSTVGRRNVSNVPGQALILMNDPFVLAQAQLWARRNLEKSPSLAPAERVANLYREAFARLPSSDETAAALAFLDEQAKELSIPPDRVAAEPRLWSDLCHVLINVKEFIYLP